MIRVMALRAKTGPLVYPWASHPGWGPYPAGPIHRSGPAISWTELGPGGALELHLMLLLVLIIAYPILSRWRGVKKAPAAVGASKGGTSVSASDAGVTMTTAAVAAGSCHAGTAGAGTAAATPGSVGQSGPTHHQPPSSSSEGPGSEAKPVSEAVRSRGRSKQDK